MVKLNEPFPFKGQVVWLTPEQGGRSAGPPRSFEEHDYAQVAYVPPNSPDTGMASIALRGYTDGAWRSPAEAAWLVVENEGDQHLEPGSVAVVCEGYRPVAYFHVQRVAPT